MYVLLMGFSQVIKEIQTELGNAHINVNGGSS